MASCLCRPRSLLPSSSPAEPPPPSRVPTVPRVHSLPEQLLRGCTMLATLSVHGNPLVAERMRELPGFDVYDARRKAKHDKQVGWREVGDV